MKNFFECRRMPYPQSFLVDIVLAVDQYAEFLPWVTESTIKDVDDASFVGVLSVGYGAFSHSYVSKVNHGKRNGDGYFVEAISLDAPFKKLVNLWEFMPISDNETEIKLTLNMDLQFGLMAMALAPVFEKASQTMIQAFEERARMLSSADTL